MKLAGKVALVTGAGSGIGRATALRLAEAGATVVASDVDPARVRAVAEALGEPHRASVLDVSSRVAWDDAVAEVVEARGGIDVVHLNAGVTSRPPSVRPTDDPLGWLTDDAYRRIVGVNVDGVVHGTLAALPHLEARGGAIVVTSSAAGIIGWPPDPFYSLSKFALNGFVLTLAPWLAGRGITLNAIAPVDAVDTGMLADDHKDDSFVSPSVVAEGVVEVLESGETGGFWFRSRSELLRYTGYGRAQMQARIVSWSRAR
jgi:NAD(P)-dependent dehydrogenase (short-subunit alcohol dehydrogenase family)